MLQLFGSLKSRDPSDVFAEVKVHQLSSHVTRATTIHASPQAASDSRIRVSVVGLSAEMYEARSSSTVCLCNILFRYVLKFMCDSCQGTYTVASDGDHLKQLLQLHIPGPPSDHEHPTVAPFIQMGFPSKLRSSLPMYVALAPFDSTGT